MADNIKDESRVEELLKVIDDLERTHIEIGIIGEGKKYKDKGSVITVLGVATIHEFGVDVTDKNGNKVNIPERSFIRTSYDKHKEDLFEFGKELERVLTLELPVESFFVLVGEWAVGVIQKHITEDVKEPALADSTIKAKGSDNPLIDTEQLRDSISYQIIRK